MRAYGVRYEIPGQSKSQGPNVKAEMVFAAAAYDAAEKIASEHGAPVNCGGSGFLDSRIS